MISDVLCDALGSIRDYLEGPMGFKMYGSDPEFLRKLMTVCALMEQLLSELDSGKTIQEWPHVAVEEILAWCRRNQISSRGESPFSDWTALDPPKNAP